MSDIVKNDGLNVLINNAGAVSYTHLDVYKRQRQSSPLVSWEDARLWLVIGHPLKYTMKGLRTIS